MPKNDHRLDITITPCHDDYNPPILHKRIQGILARIPSIQIGSGLLNRMMTIIKLNKQSPIQHCNITSILACHAQGTQIWN